MNIGFLSPRSNAYPSIGLELMSGLKLFLKEQGSADEISLIVESIAFGGVEKEVYQKAEKLLMVDDVDILLAFIDERVLEILKPLLYASGKLMIIINAGANYPLNWVPQANIVYLTLQHAFCNWLTGANAATTGEKTAAAITTFYDCGYLHAASIVKGFEKNGGSIAYNFVNKDKYDESFSVDPLIAFLAEKESPAKILCTFDSVPAALLYSALDKADSKKGSQLFVSPMMLEKKALENIGAGFYFSISGHTSWNQEGGNEGNISFKKLCEENKKPATIFSLLGWEAAMIIQHVFKNSGKEITDGAALVDGLTDATFESPRGLLQLDPETNFFLTPVHACTIEAGTNSLQTAVLNDEGKNWKQFIEEPTSGFISGWTNTYLCY